MLRLEVLDGRSPGGLAAARHLVEVATGDRRPLSDALWLELDRGSAQGVVALDGDGEAAAWAQYAGDERGWTVEVVRRSADVALAGLLGRTLEAIADRGGGPVRWWTFDESAAACAIEAGFVEERALHQMHVALPLAERTDVVTRPFVVGRDEAAWLEVNNAAFGWHPEQGGWDLDTLRLRESEPWFDPNGFLLHERDGRLVAFCWTKVHHDVRPVTGEIYVIAVHPDAHGQGLGRALTVAGLQHIASQGIDLGMLYVDRDNAGAVALYLRLGFTISRTDLAFVCEVASSGSTP